MASRERERKKIYVTKKNVFEEKRMYLHGCFDSFGMLRFASKRVIKESSKSSRCVVAQMNATTTPKRKEEKKNTFFAQAMCLGFYTKP